MLQAITKRLKRGKRGISTVIVIMLSLVLVVIIVGNVVLWNYQMNQVDLERMQETLSVLNATQVAQSPWISAKADFTVHAGTKLSGGYADIRDIDDSYESFIEAPQGSYTYNPSSYALGGSSTHTSGSLEDLASDDGGYMSFRSSGGSVVNYAESLGYSSTTSETYRDKVVLSFTPYTTGNFIIIAAAEVTSSTTSYHVQTRLTVDSATYQELAYRPKDYSDWYPFNGLKRLTLNGGSTYEIKLQYCSSYSGAIAGIRDARIVVLGLQSEYAESEELSTTTNTFWQDKATLTFTPSSSGDYLVVAAANYRGSHTNRDVYVRLVQDSFIVHSDTSGRPGSGGTANYYNFGVMRQVTLDASQHDFSIQYCSSSYPGEAGVIYAHILVLPLSQFDSVHYAEDESESWYAPSYFTDKVVNTYAAESGDYLMLGSIAYKSYSTSRSVGIDFQTDDTSQQQLLVEHRSGNDYESAFFMTKQSLSAGSKTDKIQWMGENTSPRVKNARLISCKLPSAAQTVEVELSGTADTQSWVRMGWTADLSFTTSDVATTLQLYNYAAVQYPANGDGYMTDTIGESDVTKSQQITAVPTNFRDAEGNWKIKIVGTKTSDVPFELKIDLTAFEATSSDVYRLNISNDFATGVSAESRDVVTRIEVLLRYNVTESAEKWFLKAYNWESASFNDAGFNDTAGSQPALEGWTNYTIAITGNCADYINNEGVMRLQFFDEGTSTDQAIVNVDYLGVNKLASGAQLEIKNSGPLTLRIVAVWVTTAETHQRISVDWFMNAGESGNYTVGAGLPDGAFIVKVVTERGNIAVFSSG